MTAGDDVASLQQRLNTLGFDSGRVDGVFGPDTDRALREFQRNVGLSEDGTCGPAVWRALDRLSRTVKGGAAATLRSEHHHAMARTGVADKVVVIDPGHGGPDYGDVGNRLAERSSPTICVGGLKVGSQRLAPRSLSPVLAATSSKS